MPHFAVLVRVPACVKERNLERKITELMLPYMESGCGDDDSEELEKYLTFTDVEDEYKQRYETEMSNMVRLESGEVLSKYDHRFRNPELFGSPQFILPPGAVGLEIPHKEVYPTFEKFMADYAGYKRRDPQTGRYGYWQNPNAKWDSWSIGGRWTGHLAIGYNPYSDPDNFTTCTLCRGTGTRPDWKYTEEDTHVRQPSPAGHPVIGKGCNGCTGTGWELKWTSDFKKVGNYLRISVLDWPKIQEETDKELEKFWKGWSDLCNDKESGESSRMQAISLGLVVCKDEKELTGTEWKTIPWDSPDTPEDEKRHRYDVLIPITKEALVTKYREAFNPLITYARLDTTHGWQSVGEMGWWGVGSDTPESTQKFNTSFESWVKEGNQEDWLVVVDCHI